MIGTLPVWSVIKEVNEVLTVEEWIAKMPEEDQRIIAEGTKALIAESDVYRDYLYQARQQTKTHLSKKLRMKPENFSRLEKRADLLLAALTASVEEMGGTLRLVAEFPGRPKVMVEAFSDLNNEDQGPRFLSEE